MAEGKNKVIFYPSWAKIFEALSNEEAGRLIKHFCAYITDENPNPVDRITEISFIPIEDQLKRDLDKWLEIKKKRAEAGSQGGKQRVANQANASFGKQKQANQAVNVTVNDTVKDIIIYLNTATGKNYKPNTKATINTINARLSEGYSKDDFFKVIDIKSKKWKATEYEQYLRPQTLFGNKFESYLNEQPQKETQQKPNIGLFSS